MMSLNVETLKGAIGPLFLFPQLGPICVSHGDVAWQILQPEFTRPQGKI